MATWQTYPTPNTGAETINDLIALTAGNFVAVGSNGTVLTSSDSGQTWTARTAAAANNWRGLAFDGTTVVAVSDGGANRVMVSTDLGHTWTSKSAAEANSWASVTYAAFLGMFVAVSTDGVHRVMTSINSGATWTARTAAAAQAWSGVAASPSLLMAVAINNPVPVMTSSDGIAWASVSDPQVIAIVGGGSNQVVYSSAAAMFAVAGESTTTATASVALSATGASWSHSAAAPLTGYLTFTGFVSDAPLTGFLGSLPLNAAAGSTPTIIGESFDLGSSWTDFDSGFPSPNGWFPGACDQTSGTVVFWDQTQTNTMLVGSFNALTRVSPATGSIAGGQSVTITGFGFNAATGVTFGGVAATNVVIVNNTTITATTPAHASGAVTVTVTGVASASNLYTYVIVATKLKPLPYNQQLTDMSPGKMDANWFRVLQSWGVAIENPVLSAASIVPAESIIGVLGVAQIPTLPWTRIDKAGSSLGDLTTRSATDISSGVLANAYGGTGRAYAYSYNPVLSFSVPTGTFAIALSRLDLTTVDMQVYGTGRFGVL